MGSQRFDWDSRHKRTVAAASIRSIRYLTEWGMMGIAAIAPIVVQTAASAAELVDWSYNPNTLQIEVTVPGGTSPNYFILAQPPRIVLDLPNTQVGNVPEVRTYPGAVRQIRVGQFQPGLTRIVIELVPDAVFAPGQVELQPVASSGAVNERWMLRPLLANETPAETVATPAPSSSATADLSTVDPAAPSAIAPAPAEESENAVQPDSSLASDLALDIDNQASESEPERDSPDPDTEAEPLPPLEPGALEIPVEVPPPLPVAPEEDISEEDIPEASSTDVAEDFSDEEAVDIQVDEPLFDEAPVAESEPAASEPPIQALQAEPEREAIPAPRRQATATVSEAEARFDDEDSTAAADRVESDRFEPDEPDEPNESGEVALADPTPTPAAVAPDEPPASSAETTNRDAVVELEAETLANLPPAELPGDRSVTVTVPSLSAAVTSGVAAGSNVAANVVVINFGEPLRGLATASASTTGSDVVVAATGNTLIPSGTVLRLQYPRDVPLALTPGSSRQEVLLLSQAIRDRAGTVIAPAGTPVIGRFETRGDRIRFSSQAIALGTRNVPLVGVSAPITGAGRRTNTVTIQPNQTIELRLVRDVAP